MAGIYFHIPFCRQACHYCDFHFSTNTAVVDELVQVMVEEIRLRKDYLGPQTVDTVYFGGGTPSLLNAGQVATLLTTIREHFTVRTESEITLEANPDDLTPAHLDALRLTGVNRLSIGIQSFQDSILRFLNRSHDATTAVESIKSARSSGFDNLNIDLIYGIPGLDTTAWLADVQRAIDLNPDHVSAYSLTIEPRTVFGNYASKGKLALPPDDIVATHLERALAHFEQAGYEQYEISNFCKPGKESRHNSSYWRQQSYLGIGPSAHSYNQRTRQFNIANNHLYIKSIREGHVPAETEVLTTTHHVNEYLLTTLRTRWGSDLTLLRDRYGYDVLVLHGEFVRSLIENGLAVTDKNILKLTRKGRLLADEITSRLFLT